MWGWGFINIKGNSLFNFVLLFLTHFSDPDSERDKILLTAKMNFLANAVPGHINLVNIVGASPEGTTELSPVSVVSPVLLRSLIIICSLFRQL